MKERAGRKVLITAKGFDIIDIRNTINNLIYTLNIRFSNKLLRFLIGVTLIKRPYLTS